MYRPLKISFKEDFPHWMPNISPCCKEAKGINMTIKDGSIGIYNPVNDTYEFEPTLAKESRGFRGGSDPSKKEYFQIWYSQNSSFVPVFNADFILHLKSLINIIDDNKQFALF